MPQPPVQFAADSMGNHGLFTLSVIPGEITTITLPERARIIRLITPSADLSWCVDADPEAPGIGVLTDGAFALKDEITAISVPTGAQTLRMRSDAAAVTMMIEVRW